MNTLPTSIEAYLEEAGFSSTEILILKRLMADDALTQREISSKTGKSTGVLDQAMKKLLQKGIIIKESINEVPKYRLQSMQAVAKWMEADMLRRRETMLRKFQSFSAFVATVESEQKRPEMEHFEGIEGIKKAYTLLLECGADFVRYGPPPPPTEEDPLRDFRVQYFRERHRRGIFSRVISHNTPMGRRFQSRDPFEYRRTILVDPEIYPFTFDKIIAGNTVACFQTDEQRACFIHFPELATEERAFFERLWNKKLTYEQPATSSPVPPPLPAGPVEPPIITVPIKTRTLSQLREFFLSRKSIATFVLCGFLAGGITYGLYRHNLSLNTVRIQERVKSIAATGALQFNVEDLKEFNSPADIQKPQYAKVVYLLNEIRRQNDDVAYAYIMKPGSHPDEMIFVADADSLSIDKIRDINFDGDIDEEDQPTLPGDIHIDKGGFPPTKDGLHHPVGFEPYDDDDWGIVIAGWAPIKDVDGKTFGILGIDVFADEVQDLTRNTFLPIYYFFGFFFLFVLIRMAAFNRSLFKEIYELLKSKKSLTIIITGSILAAIATVILYSYDLSNRLERERERITSIAATGALQFSPDDLDALQSLQDVSKPEHARVVQQLHNIQKNNSQILYTYLVRPKKGTTTFEFIADGEAHGYDFQEPMDVDKDGDIDDSDEIAYPGLPYDVSYNPILATGNYQAPIAMEKPLFDKWGGFIAGYAPIRNGSGTIVGILAVDVDADWIYYAPMWIFTPIIILILVLGCIFLFYQPAYKSSLLHQIFKVLRSRKVLIVLALCALISLIVTYGMYAYTLSLMKHEIGTRLMSIAATGALQIDGDDLENIRFARDMRTEEYQRVFNKLDEIREKNKDVLYVYILRPTDDPQIAEFVVDVDSNYFIPFDEIDYNNDGVADDADENVAPGVRYDLSGWESFHEGMKKPTFETNVVVDQWCMCITGSAPIFNKQGMAVAILAIDMDVTDVYELAKQRFKP